MTTPFDVGPRIETWRQLLLDTSKRNRLVSFKAGRGGGLEIVHQAAADLWQKLVVAEARFEFPWKRDLLGLPAEVIDNEQLAVDPPTDDTPPLPPIAQEFTALALKSHRLRPDHLLSDQSDKQLNTRLGRLALAAREAQAEQGVNVLYLAFGFLKWYESEDSTEEVRSPLLLVPVRLRREGVEAPWRLGPEEDEIRRNDTLAELLRVQFRVTLPEPGERQPDPDDEAAWLANYLPKVRESVADFRRWEVQERVGLGVFNFQKLAMWDDLGRNAERIAAHPLCRAIAGDASVDLRPPSDMPKAEELDEKVPPTATNQILDADSSQQAAIEAVKRGAHLVLDGPPGTGKSQTIANVIGEFLAAGKTVLFVSEKTAALDVVRRRLEACRLGDFCLEVHSHRANRKAVVTELGRCLGVTAAPSHDLADDLRKLGEARAELNAFVRELHRPRPPLGLTAFQAHGELARLDVLKGRSRVAIPDVRSKDETYLERVTAVLARLGDCKPVFADPGHPWRGCKVTAWSTVLRDDVRFHLGRLERLVPRVVEAMQPLVRLAFAPEALSVSEWRSGLAEAKAALAVPVCPPEWFQGNARATAESVVNLDTASRRYRELLPTSPELSPTALRGLDPAELDAAAAVPFGRSRLLARRASVSELAAKLREVNILHRAVAEKCRVAQDAAQRAIADSGLSLEVPSTRTLPVFADQLERLSAIGSVLAGWRDPARRKELLAVLGRAVDEVKAATGIRTELAARLAPAAFAPESSTLAKRAVGFRSLFWRLLLFGGWRSLREKVAEWYPRGLPPTPELLADLGKLAEYHKLASSLGQIAAAYPADVVITDGVPDWGMSFARVQDVDTALSPLPVAAQATFTPPDRAKVAAALGPLRKATGELLAAAEAQNAVYDAKDVTNYNPQELAAWAADHAKYADREAQACDTAVSLLAPGKDLDPTALPALLKTAAELVRLVRDAERLCSGLSPGADAALAKDWSADRQLAEKLLAFLQPRPGPVSPGLAAALTEPPARDELANAIRRSEGVASDGFDDSWSFLTEKLFDPDARVSTGVSLMRVPSGVSLIRLPLPEFAGWCRSRVADADRLLEWVRYTEAERDTTAGGVGTILDEVRRGEFPPEEAADAFRARFLRLWVDAVEQDVPELRRFAAEEHERRIARFRSLDRRSLTATPDRIRHVLLSSPSRCGLADGDAPASSEVGILLKEVHKKARHLPLRRLFAQIPNLLPRLKPCLMMSPLAVSTYLQSPDTVFDLVIFDEASQVRPHDAICAIYRGRQLVVSGDQKQLPPTSFFERGFDADARPQEPDDSLADYESVLDVCCTLGLARRRLRWHYRSRREGLIAFSNRFFYNDQLVTFPSARDADGTPAVTFRHVPDGRFKDGENPVEARAVAGLVLDHFRDQPGKTLGVIAFSQRQQFRILDELETLRKQRPEFEEFFCDDRDDPFFVKNLENVQGDERDVMVLSVGYGPDATGKVAMRFGPLNRQGGERRLNVAVTRAREHAVVVSSMTSADIDLSRASGDGPRLLKAYLDYAQQGTAALARAVSEADRCEFGSPFERAVAEELERQGLTVHRQVGCGGFRIDLAVVEADKPGHYRLGVECDGAAYHSSATARDRDRLRQEVLEGLGWRISRVWSTDWVRNRAGQVRKVMDALTQKQPPAPVEPVLANPAREGGGGDPVIPVLAGGVRQESPEAAPRLIENVPEAEIETLLLDTVTRFGGTGTEDLVKRVSRHLGYQRTGEKIRERIAGVLNALLTAGRVKLRDDDRVWPS
jgi:very-short-patch-repair endonuclease